MLYVNARQPEACPVAMSRETWGVLAPTLRLSHYSFDEGRANSLTRNATHSPTDNDRTPPMLQHNPHPLETNIFSIIKFSESMCNVQNVQNALKM